MSKSIKFQPKFMLIEKISTGYDNSSHTVIWLDDMHKLVYDTYIWSLQKRIDNNPNTVKYNVITHSNMFCDVILKYKELVDSGEA